MLVDSKDLLLVAVIGERGWCHVTFDALIDDAADPVELLHAELLPSWVSPVNKLLGTLVVVHEGARLSQQVVPDLVLELWQLVHVLGATMILLGLRVADSLVQALL